MKIHQLIFPFFRKARMKRFAQAMNPGDDDVVLDVGGHTGIWNYTDGNYRIEFINLTENAISRVDNPRYGYRVGDATKMDFDDGEFDICFSNSVIEHLYTWESQQVFAEACRRIGRKVWVQTPAKVFPIEPHVIGLGVHWLGKDLRRKWVRWLSVWGWRHRPSRQEIDQFVNEVRLLSFREMQTLFPDCEIVKERFLGVFVKSYIAKRA